MSHSSFQGAGCQLRLANSSKAMLSYHVVIEQIFIQQSLYVVVKAEKNARKTRCSQEAHDTIRVKIYRQAKERQITT